MTRWIWAIGLAGIVAAGCDVNSVLEQLSEARRLSSSLLTELSKAGDAGNRAVMAETEDQSAAFAREAELANVAIQSDIDKLDPLLRSLGYSDEVRILERFKQQFIEYRAVDRTVLDLALEQTNVRAQRLSLGAAQEAADACRDALDLVQAARPADHWQVRALVAMAVASVREVQVLQARHIPEPDAAAMDRIETRMASADVVARQAIARIGVLAGASSRPHVTAAIDALDRLGALNTEIRTLSRRNSNVRSLVLSLGEKRVLALKADETLQALRDALAKRGFTGTR